MPLHKEIFPVENHIPYAFEYSNEAARLGAGGLVGNDIGKLAIQQDDNTLWILINDSPVTWAFIGGRHVFTLSCGRNFSATNIWLRTTNGVPLNSAPFRLPFNATLMAITATTSSAATWDCEVYKNADVRAGGIPSDPNKIAELVLNATIGDQGLFNIDVNAYDEIGVFCRGTLIPASHVDLYFIRR
jgi:hypothetical protein